MAGDSVVRRNPPGEQEENYYRAMHYLAGALWLVGAADQALAALNDVLQKVAAEHGQPSSRTSPRPPPRP